jgi:hypothetical protein
MAVALRCSNNSSRITMRTVEMIIKTKRAMNMVMKNILKGKGNKRSSMTSMEMRSLRRK